MSRKCSDQEVTTTMKLIRKLKNEAALSTSHTCRNVNTSPSLQTPMKLVTRWIPISLLILIQVNLKAHWWLPAETQKQQQWNFCFHPPELIKVTKWAKHKSYFANYFQGNLGDKGFCFISLKVKESTKNSCVSIHQIHHLQEGRADVNIENTYSSSWYQGSQCRIVLDLYKPLLSFI